MVDVGARLGIATALVAALLMTLQSGIHTVREGYIGVYWRAGKLLSTCGESGLNFKLPFIDRMEEVQITLQTDRVNNIPCGTSGGVVVTFSAIEVVNRLSKDKALGIIRDYGVEYDKAWIFDKIHHEINQFCSSHTLQEVYIDLFSTLDESLVVALQSDIDKYAPGITIVAVRVTKPTIPKTILTKYEQMEEEKTKLLVAIQQANVERQLSETHKMKAEINAQQLASVSLIDKDRTIQEKQADKKIKQIEDETYLGQQKAVADAEFYTIQKRAEANKLLYTPEFLQYAQSQALSQNTKIYFGEKIPSVLLDAHSTHNPQGQAAVLSSAKHLHGNGSDE